MKRAALVLVALLALLTGCTPKGQPCNRVGDVTVQDGHSYRCVKTSDGRVWK